jgi:KDO2-lipid IV(A) lauroyltransferase
MTMRGYYDLLRALQLPREKLSDLVDLSDGSQEILGSLWDREGGTVVVSSHLGGFDLGGLTVVGGLPEVQSLTLPDPPAGFKMTNELRRLSGAKVTPLSPPALRQALRLLRRGGVVAMAGDRPVSELDAPVLFFGRPARVPSGHVRLALKTGAVVVLAYCALIPETQRYMVFVDPPLEMIRTGDGDEELQINLRRILDRLEAAIRQWPEQWQMYVPVWPEIVEA